MTPDRYTSPGRRGANRALTPTEATAWSQVTTTWVSTPPWTDQVLAANKAVRDSLVNLYEDGVSIADLATTANWGHPRVAGILHRARLAGEGTGSRRYIPPALTARQQAAASKAPFRRNLTPDEEEGLARAYALLPTYGTSASRWAGPHAVDLLARMNCLSFDNVSLEVLGKAIGMSRQAVHQHLTRHRDTQVSMGALGVSA